MQSIIHSLALGVGFVLFAAGIGGMLYLAVTFFVMRGHAAPRSWRRAVSSFLREAVIVALTQPLVPFFYVFGRRMGGSRSGRPIIFVHGYFQNRADFIYLARAARRAKLGPLYGFNYSWLESIPACADRLARFVDDVRRETGQPRVAIVAHSLGGIVALEYLKSRAGAACVERCITLGTPHSGVRWRAGMIGQAARQLHAGSEYMRSRDTSAFTVPVMSIFSTHDNIVHPASVSALALRGAEDASVDDLGHLGLLFSRRVAALTIDALRKP